MSPCAACGQKSVLIIVLVLERKRSDDLSIPEGDSPEANIVRGVVCDFLHSKLDCC